MPALPGKTRPQTPHLFAPPVPAMVPKSSMAKSPGTTQKRPVEQPEHKAKQRANNPPASLVDAKTDLGFLLETLQMGKPG